MGATAGSFGISRLRNWLRSHRSSMKRSGVEPGEIDHCVMGNAQQTSGDAIYGARHVMLKAGCPLKCRR